MGKRGMGRIFRRGEKLYIAYYDRGREIRESVRSDKEQDAWKLLKTRLGELQKGVVVADEGKVTFENLVEKIVMDYRLNNRRSAKSALENNVKHLRSFFGFDRALDIDASRIRLYQARRREQGASVATVNRECAMLRRMFTLAVDEGKLSR